MPAFVPEVPTPDAGCLGPFAEAFLRLKKPDSTPLPILLPSRDLLLSGGNGGLAFFCSMAPERTGIEERLPLWLLPLILA